MTPAKNDDGFIVNSFAGDDRQACIAHVRSKLDPGNGPPSAALGAALPARDDRTSATSRPPRARLVMRARLPPKSRRTARLG